MTENKKTNKVSIISIILLICIVAGIGIIIAIMLNNSKSETPPPAEMFEEEIFGEDVYTLNLDAAHLLADGYLSAFEFMRIFPGNVTETDPAVYNIILPNEYAIQIEYSGDEINYIYFFDTRIGQYIDLKFQQLDVFLLERED